MCSMTKRPPAVSLVGTLKRIELNPKGMGMSGSVFPGADHVQRAGSGWCGGLGAGLREEEIPVDQQWARRQQQP